MKPQSLRRSLWLTSGLLAAGVAGTLGFFFAKVRPAEGAPLREVTGWLDKQAKAYRAEPISAQVFYPVKEEEIQAVKRDDLPKIDGKKVGVFVGPVPPEPQVEKAAPAVATGPKGLAEVGRPTMVLHAPPKTRFKWELASDPKRALYFGVGDVVPEGGRFRVVDVVPFLDPTSAVRKYRFVYESVGAVGAAGEPPKREEAVFDLNPKDAPTTAIRSVPLPPPPGAGGTVAVVAKVDGSAGAVEAAAVGASASRGAEPPPRSAVRLKGEKVGNGLRFSFDTWEAYDYFTKSKPEALLEQVKTETAVDENGRARGVKITGGVGAESIASEFDIRAGDILVSVDGKAVHDRNEVASVVKKIPKDTASVKVVIERNGRQILYEVDPRDPDTRRGAGRVRFK